MAVSTSSCSTRSGAASWKARGKLVCRHWGDNDDRSPATLLLHPPVLHRHSVADHVAPILQLLAAEGSSAGGGLCVLMRQTNIVWVCMVTGMTVLDTLVHQCIRTLVVPKDKIRLMVEELWMQLFSSPQFRSICFLSILAKCYATINPPVVKFLFINGSIVVGFGTYNTIRQLRSAADLIRWLCW